MIPTWSQSDKTFYSLNIKLWITALQYLILMLQHWSFLYSLILEQKPHLSALSRPLVLFTHKFFFRAPYTRFFLSMHTHRLNFWVNARFEKNIGVRVKIHRLPLYSGEQPCLIHCKCVSVYVCVRCCALDAVRIPKSPPTPGQHHPVISH